MRIDGQEGGARKLVSEREFAETCISSKGAGGNEVCAYAFFGHCLL